MDHTGRTVCIKRTSMSSHNYCDFNCCLNFYRNNWQSYFPPSHLLFAGWWTQAQIEAELNRHWDQLHQGLNYYKPPWYVAVVEHSKFSFSLFKNGNHDIVCWSASSAAKVKDNKDIAQPLKDFSVRISKLLVSAQKPPDCLLFDAEGNVILYSCCRVLMSYRVCTFYSATYKKTTGEPVIPLRCLLF